MDAPSFSNRLIHEKSPYLLQHAHNPVDWYPWGQEAFEKAKKLDKPIFLSIGYATCHWCHVMEKESFENPEIAQLMNETFVNIKVDREELPEVDSIYMDFAQALMSSAGGWPLNLVLTTDLKPFFAMTYLPPKNHRGLIGMPHFIEHVRGLWNSDERHHLIEQADKVVELFEQMTPPPATELAEKETVEVAVELLYELIDPVYGGLKGEPKFPMGYQSTFLLEYGALSGDSRALFCAQLSLDKMHQGGIYDHLGGGFARYAVDEQWEVPHFEKMLYDNALLARAYLDAWKYTKKEEYATVCKETVDYLLTTLAHPEGGFYSAEDADSEGHEGRYYTWTLGEIQSLLSKEDAEIFCQAFAIAPEGNFEGRTILHAPVSLEETAKKFSLSSLELQKRLEGIKRQLLEKRNSRVRPLIDDKILTSWNGLCIDVFVRAFDCFGEARYKEAAQKTARFLQKNLWKEGRLLRRWREGEARFEAGLDDYAFLIKGLLSLFEQGEGSQWLAWAIECAGLLDKEFKAESGGFYYHRSDPTLLLRKCEFYDGAEPSGNAVHAENLLRLYQITFDSRYLQSAHAIIQAAKAYMESYPPGACYHLIALYRSLNRKAATLVIALDEEATLEKQIRAVLASTFSPHLQVIWKRPSDTALASLAPPLIDKKPIDGQTAVYICRQDHCEPPLLHQEEILQALNHLKARG